MSLQAGGRPVSRGTAQPEFWGAIAAIGKKILGIGSKVAPAPPTPPAQIIILPTPQSNTNLPLILGVGGALVLILLIVMMRK